MIVCLARTGGPRACRLSCEAQQQLDFLSAALQRLRASRTELVNAWCSPEAALPWSGVVTRLSKLILSLRSYYPIGNILVQLVLLLNMCLLCSMALSGKRDAEQAGARERAISDAILEGIPPLLRKVEELVPAGGG